MKRIGLISDTHSHLGEDIKTALVGVDEIWHAGDVGREEVITELEKIAPVRAVYGNIDGYPVRGRFKQTEVFYTEGFRVIMTHIGGYPKRYNAQIKKFLDELPKGEETLFVCGHSHILRIMYDNDYQMLVMNPGAAGREGFHQKRTIITFTLNEGDVTNAQIHEFPR